MPYFLYDQVYCNFSTSNFKNPLLYENEICSYNGKFDTNLLKNKQYVCICDDSFATDTAEKSKLYIVGQEIQCSLVKKRQLIAFVLAFFFPIGLHYFYLEQYLYFVLVLLGCCTSIVGNCVFCAISSNNGNKTNLLDKLNKLNKSYSSKKKNKYNEHNTNILGNSNANKKNKPSIYTKFNLLRLFFILLGLLMVVIYVLNIFLLLFSTTKDSNGVEIKKDADLLYNILSQ